MVVFVPKSCLCVTACMKPPGGHTHAHAHTHTHTHTYTPPTHTHTHTLHFSACKGHYVCTRKNKHQQYKHYSGISIIGWQRHNTAGKLSISRSTIQQTAAVKLNKDTQLTKSLHRYSQCSSQTTAS